MHSDHLAVTASVTYGASVKNVGGEASVKLPLALVSPIPIIKEPGKPGDATDIVFVTLPMHSSWNSNCAVHKSLGNGEGTPP